MAKKIKATKQSVIQATTSVAMKPWLVNMNDEQIAAIMHGTGPARVLASAGGGKTRTLVHRIARLVVEGTPAQRICALTFSKKAADEMEARSEKLGVGSVRIGTWHRLCLRMLRDEGVVDDGWDLGALPRGLLKDILGYRNMKWDQADPNLVETFIAKCKAHLHAPDHEGAQARARVMFGGQAQRALEAFFRVNEECERRAFLTFDDYLVRAADVLSNEETRSRWAAKFDYLMMDEVQDESPAQKHIGHILARDHRNYMVIGDCQQAIYGFREATPASLANFEVEWPDAVTYRLPRNYRSGDTIIAAANAVVMRAAPIGATAPTEMIASRSIEGSVKVEASEDLEDEALKFANIVRTSVDAGDSKYSDHCALYRVNAQSRALEEALLGARIPYVVVGGTSFYERREVRALLAYLRLAEGRGDEEAVAHCINAPFRFLGKAFVEKVQEAAESRLDAGESSSIEWGALVREARGPGIQFRQKQSAEEWAGIVDEMKRAVSAGGDAGKPALLIDGLVRRVRYLEWLSREEGQEMLDSSTASNVRELIRVCDRFPDARSLLDFIDTTIREARNQREDKQAGGNRVLLMCTHRSKGLEFKHVFIATFNDLVFPHVMGDQAEERRLAYVAITRAQDSLVVSHVRRMVTRAGLRDAYPSPYVGEILAAQAEHSLARAGEHDAVAE